MSRNELGGSYRPTCHEGFVIFLQNGWQAIAPKVLWAYPTLGCASTKGHAHLETQTLYCQSAMWGYNLWREKKKLWQTLHDRSVIKIPVNILLYILISLLIGNHCTNIHIVYTELIRNDSGLVWLLGRPVSNGMSSTLQHKLTLWSSYPRHVECKSGNLQWQWTLMK